MDTHIALDDANEILELAAERLDGVKYWEDRSWSSVAMLENTHTLLTAVLGSETADTVEIDIDGLMLTYELGDNCLLDVGLCLEQAAGFYYTSAVIDHDELS